MPPLSVVFVEALIPQDAVISVLRVGFKFAYISIIGVQLSLNLGFHWIDVTILVEIAINGGEALTLADISTMLRAFNLTSKPPVKVWVDAKGVVDSGPWSPERFPAVALLAVNAFLILSRRNHSLKSVVALLAHKVMDDNVASLAVHFARLRNRNS